METNRASDAAMDAGQAGTGWTTGDRLNAEVWAALAQMDFAREMGTNLFLPDHPEADAGPGRRRRRAANLSRKQAHKAMSRPRRTVQSQTQASRSKHGESREKDDVPVPLLKITCR